MLDGNQGNKSFQRWTNELDSQIFLRFHEVYGLFQAQTVEFELEFPPNAATTLQLTTSSLT
jgi:hypothetical protein